MHRRRPAEILKSMLNTWVCLCVCVCVCVCVCYFLFLLSSVGWRLDIIVR